MILPQNFEDFLRWFKDATEAEWKTLEDGDPLRNAIWIGMSEHDINKIEQKHGIRFAPDHRAFLRILHTPDIAADPEVHSFFDWLRDDEIALGKLDLYTDFVRDKFWLPSWGEEPDSDDLKRQRFTTWYEQAPRLIPIYAHRYVVSEPFRAGNPVLSIRGCGDIIIYGWNLRQYLLHEFDQYLPRYLFQKIDDPEDTYWEFIDEVQDQFDASWANSRYEDIPAWGELIRYGAGTWSYVPRRKPQ